MPVRSPVAEPPGATPVIVVLEADGQIYSAEQLESVTGLNASVAACVRRAPAQYQWEYKRFRRLPEPYPKRYQFK